MTDLFRVKPKLRYLDEEEGSSSRAGKIATFVLVVGTVVIGIFLIINVLNRDSPNFLSADTIIEDPPELSPLKDAFPFGFALEDPVSFAPYIDESIYQVKILQYYKKRSKDANGKDVMTQVTYNIMTERCSESNFGEAGYKFSNLHLNDRYCISKNQSNFDPKLGGVWESIDNYYITISIVRCVNSSSNPVVCASPEKIEQMLTGSYIDMSYVDYVVDANNYDNPITRFRNTFFTNVGPNFQREINMYLKTLTIETDRGFFAAEKTNLTVTAMDNAQELFSINTSGEKILVIQIQLSRNQKLYFRSYTKALDLISQINGFFAFLFLLFQLILSPFQKYKYYEELINKVFDIKLALGRKRRKGKIFTKPNKMLETSLEKKNEENTKPNNSKDENEKIKINIMDTETPVITKNDFDEKVFHSEPTEDEKQHVEALQTERNLLQVPVLHPMLAVQPKSHHPDSSIVPEIIEEESRDSISSQSLQKSNIISTSKIEDGPDFIPTVHQFVDYEDVMDEDKRISLGFFEFYLSFIFKSKKTKEKIRILKEGIDTVNKCLDVFTILKNTKELEQLKLLLLSPEQVTLMKHLPKPIIPNPDMGNAFKNPISLLRFFNPDQVDIMNKDSAVQGIRDKRRMNSVDKKLLRYFKK